MALGSSLVNAAKVLDSLMQGWPLVKNDYLGEKKISAQ
jgi:hypothetical protein